MSIYPTPFFFFNLFIFLHHMIKFWDHLNNWIVFWFRVLWFWWSWLEGKEMIQNEWKLYQLLVPYCLDCGYGRTCGMFFNVLLLTIVVDSWDKALSSWAYSQNSQCNSKITYNLQTFCLSNMLEDCVGRWLSIIYITRLMTFVVSKFNRLQ